MLSPAISRAEKCHQRLTTRRHRLRGHSMHSGKMAGAPARQDLLHASSDASCFPENRAIVLLATPPPSVVARLLLFQGGAQLPDLVVYPRKGVREVVAAQVTIDFLCL